MNKFSVVLVSLLAGCATAPNWQRTDIKDKAVLGRQLTADHGQCTLVSVGAAPMPTIPSTTPQAQNINVQGRTYNSSTGTWSNSTYTGQITSGPSGGFGGGMASGFNSGLALGATIRAQQQQDAIYVACMNAKGWTDIPAGTDSARIPAVNPVTPSVAKNSEVQGASDSANIAWRRDVEEFLWLFPGYTEGNRYQQLDSMVRRVANEHPQLSEKIILLRARKALQKEGVEVSAPNTPTHRLAAMSYENAAQGDTKAQLAMAAVHSDKSGEGLGPERATYWANEAARRGDPLGQTLMGLKLFHGEGIEQNKVAGYRLVKQAAAVDSDARDLLPKLEAAMSEAELAAARY